VNFFPLFPVCLAGCIASTISIERKEDASHLGVSGRYVITG